jgi:hypothetical protein
MSTIQLRVGSAGVIFLLILLSGFWLSSSGKPIHGLLLTMHKLISLAAGILFVMTLYQIHQVAKLSALELTAALVTGLFFIGAMITGALLSTGKPMPAGVLRLHQITPYLIALFTAVTLYLLLVLRDAVSKA